MGIDRIGKGGAPPATPDLEGGDKTGAADKKAPVEKSFSSTVAETEGARAAGLTGPRVETPAAEGSPLARFRAGEVDVNGYVDLKVDEVVSKLQGLSPAEIDDIRKMLRDQIATDPGLGDLVRTATGPAPAPPAQ